MCTTAHGAVVMSPLPFYYCLMMYLIRVCRNRPLLAGRRREEEQHITHRPNKNVAVVQLACCWISVMCSSLEKDERSRYLASRALQELHGTTTLVVTKQQLT